MIWLIFTLFIQYIIPHALFLIKLQPKINLLIKRWWFIMTFMLLTKRNANRLIKWQLYMTYIYIYIYIYVPINLQLYVLLHSICDWIKLKSS
jgi:hypothetical protein